MTMTFLRAARRFGLLLSAAVLGLQAQQLAPPPLAATTAPARERVASPRVAAMLAASMPKYQPKPAIPPLSDGDQNPDETIVLMAPVKVIESKSNAVAKLLAEKIDDEKRRIELATFNWKDGGTLIETDRVQVLLKYNPKHKGFDLLHFKF